MIWHSPIPIFSPVICIGHVLCPYIWLNLNDLWPLNSCRQNLGQKLKISRNDLTHPHARFQLATSYSSWDITLLLFLEKWAWPKNRWPRPLKNYTALYCTSVLTHPPNSRNIHPTIVEKTLTQFFCKEKKEDEGSFLIKNWGSQRKICIRHVLCPCL